jgi:hypothetical protein
MEPKEEHLDSPGGDEEESEVTLTQLIKQNKNLIKDLKQELEKAKKRIMDGPQ